MASNQVPQHVRALAQLAACLATFQSICWGIMALLAVIGYDDCDLWDNTSTFLTSMQFMYFQERDKCPNNPLNGSPAQGSEWLRSIMGPDSILAWMIILLSFNCAWFFASLTLLAAWRNARMTFTCSVTAIWCVVTSAVMVIDLVACAMFGADYGKIVMTESITSFPYLAPPAVIMTLAARGFVLWFVNLALLAVLVHSLPAIRRHKKAAKEHEKQLAEVDLYGPPAPGYESYNQGFVMNEVARPSSNPPKGYYMYPDHRHKNLPRADYAHTEPKRHAGVARTPYSQHKSNPIRGQNHKHTGF